MRIEIIDNTAGVAAIASSWRDLANESARPFQEFEWAYAWLDTIGRCDGRKPCVVTAWDREALVGILPLARRRFKGVRLLEWVGAKVTDYCDAIVRSDMDAEKTLGQMWSHLSKAGGFDVARFGQVRADAKIRTLFQHLDLWPETSEEAYSVPITWPDSEQWLRAQTSKSRARIRRGVRRMEELGLKFHVWQPGEPLEPILEAVVRQKRQWLEQRNEQGSLQTSEGADFLHKLAEALSQSGSLHLSYLTSEKGIVATHLGFFKTGIFYYYLPTYDASYAQQRVGTLLLDTLLGWCCDHRATCFDMLLGAHDYKATYGAQPTPVQTLVQGRGLLGNGAVQMYKWRRRLLECAKPAASLPQPPSADAVE